MFWKIVTDAVAIFHGLWVVFVVVGPFFSWRRPGIRCTHLIMMWITFVALGSGIYCPLSNMENSLRVHFNPSTAYSTGFIVHYVDPLVSWDLTQPQIVAAMTAWTVLWTFVYAFLWIRERQKSRRAAPTPS